MIAERMDREVWAVMNEMLTAEAGRRDYLVGMLAVFLAVRFAGEIALVEAVRHAGQAWDRVRAIQQQ